MDENQFLTEILAKADTLFSMRKMLAQFGVPYDLPLKISLKIDDRQIETEVFPAMNNLPAISELIAESDRRAEAIEFLNKVDVMYDYAEKLNIPKGKETFTIAFKFGQNFDREMSFLLGRCCPCPNQPKPCCTC